MFFECNATFVAYALLSTFPTITEKEREAVRFIIELIPCYDEATGKLRMTFDAHVLAQIYLAELRVLAGRHSYIHEGSLEEAPQARALLSVIVIPLIRHLSAEEYNRLVDSLEETHLLLSRPLDVLDELVVLWRIRNAKIAADWRSHPAGDLENYEFGVEIPGKRSLEDVLTPLPYPTKRSPLSAVVVERIPDCDLTEYRLRLIDSNETNTLPRSECAKEMELRGKPKTSSKVFGIPFLGRSCGSSESRSNSSYGSGSSGMSQLSWNDLVEFKEVMDDLQSNHSRRAADHKSNQGVRVKPPKRTQFSRYVKRLFKHA